MNTTAIAALGTSVACTHNTNSTQVAMNALKDIACSIPANYTAGANASRNCYYGATCKDATGAILVMNTTSEVIGTCQPDCLHGSVCKDTEGSLITGNGVAGTCQLPTQVSETRTSKRCLNLPIPEVTPLMGYKKYFERFKAGLKRYQLF